MIGNKSGAQRFLLFTILIALSVEFVDANNVDCEIVRKLKENSTYLEQELYEHICLANLLKLTSANESVRWCDFEKPGGSCNVTCSSLQSGDITHNLNCASKLLNSSDELMEVMTHCKDAYELTTRFCLNELNAFDALLHAKKSLPSGEPENSPNLASQNRSDPVIEHN